MPGFLMFEEYGFKEADLKGPMAGVNKVLKRMLPFSWMEHGIIGEFNVDIDPFEEARQMMHGGGAMARLAKGNFMEFSEAYQAWIAVRSLNHSISVTKDDRKNTNDRTADLFARNYNDTKKLAATGKDSYDNVLATSRANQHRPGMSNDDQDNSNDDKLGNVTVEIEVDVSLPQLIRAALPQKGDSETPLPPKQFDIAEVHMCTTAQIDAGQLTLGQSNPASALIKTLVEAFIFNIIPYFSMTMSKVTIDHISWNLQGEETSVPTVTLELSFEKAVYTYHMINGSNMNLLNLSTEFDYKNRKASDAEWSLGTLLNPFG